MNTDKTLAVATGCLISEIRLAEISDLKAKNLWVATSCRLAGRIEMFAKIANGKKILVRAPEIDFGGRASGTPRGVSGLVGRLGRLYHSHPPSPTTP